jgi:hypothetical protein
VTEPTPMAGIADVHIAHRKARRAGISLLFGGAATWVDRDPVSLVSPSGNEHFGHIGV